MADILKNEDIKILNQGSIDLMVESYSNSTRTLQIRGLTREQAISADITTSSDRSLVTSIIDITDIPIFLTARTSVRGVKRGELYIKVSLRVDGTVVALLMAGYVAETHKTVYPDGDIEGSTDGAGLVRSITGTNPAAGAEISETVPTGARWKLKSIKATLVPDATVITRVPNLSITDGAIEIAKIYSGLGALATILQTPLWTTCGYNSTTVASAIVAGLPNDLILMAGYKINTNTSAIQAGDDWGAPQLLVEEWIEP